MSGFTVKVRGGGRILREFRCPEHGVFESYEPGDAVPCPEWTDSDCPCGECQGGPCDLPSERCFTSAPLGRVRAGEVARGKSDPPPHPLALDTRPLAEGMPLNEWKAQRAALWDGQRRRELKEKT